MNFLNYEKFFESEELKLKRELKEYELEYLSDDNFSLKSKNFSKNFAVQPYDKETLPKLQEIYSTTIFALERENPTDIYAKISEAETVNYKYGGVFTSHYSLFEVPELLTTINPEQKKLLEKSQFEFLKSEYEKLPKSLKNSILIEVSERAEIICCIIEALFYFVRLTDKNTYYNGLSKSEILETYQKAIDSSKEELGFRVESPTSVENSYSVWKCKLGDKEFEIRATSDPKELHAEDNVSGIAGLTFSIVKSASSLPTKDYSFFKIDQLTSKIRSFNKL